MTAKGQNWSISGLNGPDHWRHVAEKAVREIRKLDKSTPVIIEPLRGEPDKILSDFQPLNKREFPNVIYSVHVYAGNFPTKSLRKLSKQFNPSNPDHIAGIRNAPSDVIKFQEKHNVPIYIGEFDHCLKDGILKCDPESPPVPRENAVAFIGALIDRFEKHDWMWSFHTSNPQGLLNPAQADVNSTDPLNNITNERATLLQNSRAIAR